ncbi:MULTISPECIES: hypothetical protein [unclassified Lysinibacillus]|uniref:hypothetical protein n=1 Tax=unclassified Lysinibacillus TaxID=2636778 RepID=UPI003825E0E0
MFEDYFVDEGMGKLFFLDHHQNVWLISVPTGRFVAAASLSLQKTFVADASLSLQSKTSWGRPMSRLGQQDVFCAKA